MTWSYNTGLTTDTDKVRFAIGDTDTLDQLLSNEEILALLAAEGSVDAAAAAAAYGLSAKFSRLADRTTGNFSISASQKSGAYLALAQRLTRKSSIYAVPTAGGTYTSDDDLLNADTDRKRLTLRPGIHDMPSGGTVPQ